MADHWFPSSKTCSDCGATKAKLPLHVRVFTCDLCSLVIDRDENAAPGRPRSGPHDWSPSGRRPGHAPRVETPWSRP
ncbi:zinc ribbon domain-containing protein [Streptomyces sp. NBC_01614]|uniref:Transposase n=1 Tax=Streptomyces sp. NBC_00180 TaxID=2903632 RepID=A0AAU1IBD7_9ACTN